MGDARAIASARYSVKNIARGSLYFVSHSSQKTSVGRKASSTSDQDSAVPPQQDADKIAVLFGIEVFGKKRPPVIDAISRGIARMHCGIGPIAEDRHPLDHKNDLDAEPAFDRNAGHVENRHSLGRISCDMHDLLRVGWRTHRRCRRYCRHDNSNCRRETIVILHAKQDQ